MASRKTEHKSLPNFESWGSLWHGCQCQPSICRQSVTELVNFQALLSYAKTLWEACCGGSYIWGRSAALAWEWAWPPALIIRLNVNKAGLVIQLSSRCTCLFHCQAPGPRGELPQIFRDSHRYKQHSNIAVTHPPPFPGIHWQDHLWGGAYIISSRGNAQSLPRLALPTELILATPWLPGLNSGQFPSFLLVY